MPVCSLGHARQCWRASSPRSECGCACGGVNHGGGRRDLGLLRYVDQNLKAWEAEAPGVQPAIFLAATRGGARAQAYHQLRDLGHRSLHYFSVRVVRARAFDPKTTKG